MKTNTFSKTNHYFQYALYNQVEVFVTPINELNEESFEYHIYKSLYYVYIMKRVKVIVEHEECQPYH